MVLPWGRSQPSSWLGAAALPSPVPSTVTCLIHHSVSLPGIAMPLTLLSTNVLAEKALMLSFLTLPKGDPMLSTLSCSPLLQLVENWQDWFSQRDW